MNATAGMDEIFRIINADHHDPFSILGMHFAYLENKNEIISITDTVAKGNSTARERKAIEGKAITGKDTTGKAITGKALAGKAKTEKAIVVRAFIPNAKKTLVVNLEDKIQYEMEKIREEGFFEVLIPGKEHFFDYNIEITDYHGNWYRIHDPYCFPPVLTDYDLYLFNEGNHHKIYEKLGAHICTLKGVRGTFFAVWAPCARRVSVVGNFNQWDGRRHQMRSRGQSGIWEIFIPGIGEGEIYKYEIKTQNNELYLKADPYAFYSELRPGTASVVCNIDGYKWNDEEWMKERDSGNLFDKPAAIYEVHLSSWARVIEEREGKEEGKEGKKGREGREGEEKKEGDRFLMYSELADKLVKYVKDMGFTHIELLPVTEHPYDGSWGYQVTGYYSVTSRYGKPKEFMYFVDRCHQEGIGVIIDWVPAHFPKDGSGLARFDGSALYEHQDSRQGEHPDWGTHIFNYGRYEVKNFLVSNALFWFDKYHIDGLRVDAVASMLYLDYGKKDGEWLPNKWGGKENTDAIDFLRQLNTTVFHQYPGVMMIAEESTSWALVSKPPYSGGLGFSFKWNMGWMNDYIRYISMDPIYRKYHHNNLTFSIVYAFSENFILVLSHDEVVHGKGSMINKMPGDYRQKFAGLRVSYGYMYGHPGKKLLFMGGEFGQFAEWNYKHSLDWHLLDYDMHRKLQKFVKDLNCLYKREKALYEVDFDPEGFEWIDCNDADHGVVSFIRKSKNCEELLIFVCNFTPVVYINYRIGAPFRGCYREILNSDSEIYGGGNVGNSGKVTAEDIGFHNRPYSLNLTIPPLAVIVFKKEKSHDESQ